MASSPIFGSAPNIASVRINAANTARDGSGTLFTLLTGATNGTLINTISFISANSVVTGFTAGVGAIYISDTGGTNWRLYQEVLLTRVTESNTLTGWAVQARYINGLVIPSGVVIAVTKSTHTGDTDSFDVTVEGYNY